MIGALIKFAFEQVLGPRYQRGMTAEAVLRKYLYPILLAADALDRRLENLIRFADPKWFDDPKDDYYRLSTLYLFGCYFGWCKILENEAFLQYEVSDRRSKNFSIHFKRVFKGIDSFYYFQDLGERVSTIEKATVPRLALTAIGELMIKEPAGTKDSLSTVLGFVEFARSYETSPDFKKWFLFLEKLLSGLKRSSNDLRWNRLLVLAVNLRVFVSFLDPRNRQTTPRKIYYLERLHPKVAARVRKELIESGYSGMIAEAPSEE